MKGSNIKGAVKDEQITLIENAGIVVENNLIVSVNNFDKLAKTVSEVVEIEGQQVCLPGFVDSHTHICFGGSRARDYAARNNGKTYLEIAKEGGGIWDTVQKTRISSEKELVEGIQNRASRHLSEGVTTIEVKKWIWAIRR